MSFKLAIYHHKNPQMLIKVPRGEILDAFFYFVDLLPFLGCLLCCCVFRQTNRQGPPRPDVRGKEKSRPTQQPASCLLLYGTVHYSRGSGKDKGIWRQFPVTDKIKLIRRSSHTHYFVTSKTIYKLFILFLF